MEREYTKEKPTKDGHYWLKLDGKEELVELKMVNGGLVEVREKRKSLGIISHPDCLYSGPVSNPGGADPTPPTAPPQTDSQENTSVNSISEDFKPPETANEPPPKEGEAQSEPEKKNDA